MTSQQILIVAVRLFAIFWFLLSIGHLVTALRQLEQLAPDVLSALGVMAAFLELAICMFLWFSPATLSRRLLKNDDARSDEPVPALLEWQTMLLAILGLWTVSFAIPDAVFWIVYVISYSQTYPSTSSVLEDQWPYVVATVVQLAIGGWLLLGGPRLAVFLSRLRKLGLRE